MFWGGTYVRGFELSPPSRCTVGPPTPGLTPVLHSTHEACVSPDSPDFNPCMEHYRPISLRQPSSIASPERNASSENENGDSGSTASSLGQEGSDDVNQECAEESTRPLPAGTVCDHESYR